MSGGGGRGVDPLQLGVMVGASILAPEVAPLLFEGEGLFAGAELGAGAASALTGAGLGGLGAAATGGNPLMGAIGGGFGGYGMQQAGGIGGLFESLSGSGAGGAGTMGSGVSAGPALPTPIEGPVITGDAGIGAGVSGYGEANALPEVTRQISEQGLKVAAGELPSVSSVGSGLSALSPMEKVALGGAGAYGLSALMNKQGARYNPQTQEPYRGGPLQRFHYDPGTYQPAVAIPPNPPYRPIYAAGGGLMDAKDNVDFMGGDMYPQSQIQRSYYATPSQMPTSAQQAMASYEPKVNPLTGAPTAHMATGGLTQEQMDKLLASGQQPFASGGIASLGGYSDGGRLLMGAGDGMSDSIPARIGRKQPARLADGEFVVPADVVSHIGNGSTNAGAKKLYAMMDKVRRDRTGKKVQAPKINSNKYMPA